MKPAISRKRLGFLVLPAFLLCAGCVPVHWLPDSSGFLYVENGSAKLHDVASGKKQVLVEKLPGETPWPALSPNGKQFAVARLGPRDTGKQFDMQLFVYDLQGKEIHRSPAFPWREQDGRELITTAVFWARKHEKLLVHDFQEPERTGIYDLERKTLVQIGGLPAVFGGTSFRPDDRGFLVSRNPTDELSLFLIDWNGKEQAIRVDRDIAKNEERVNVVRSPWRGTSSWNGNMGVVAFKKWQVRVDTEKRMARLEKAPEDPLDVGPLPVVQRFDFPGAGARLRVVVKAKANDKDATIDRLLMWKPGAKKPEQVFEVKNGFFVLSPSPDGKWLAVRMMGDDVDDIDFMLVSKDGEVRNRPEN